jgi:hypothetical protein
MDVYGSIINHPKSSHDIIAKQNEKHSKTAISKFAIENR